MKSITERKVEINVVLELTLEESSWLRSLMQNALYENESELDSKMRELFWNNLPDGRSLV